MMLVAVEQGRSIHDNIKKMIVDATEPRSPKRISA